MDLEEVVCKVMTQNRIQWLAFVKMVTKLWVPEKQSNYTLFKEDFVPWS
jgi:hypothetical protein